jgi:hypothetical protein
MNGQLWVNSLATPNGGNYEFPVTFGEKEMAKIIDCLQDQAKQIKKIG